MTRTERTFYIVFAGYSVAAYSIAPVYPLFLLSRGLDLFQVNVVLAVYLITVFLFEVPTGAVADVFGRKISFLLACVVRTVAYGLYAFADDFTDCLIAEFIDAVGTTLMSGALEAWAVDGIRAEGDRRPTDPIFARAQTILRIGMIGGGIACGHLAAIDFAYAWYVTAASFATTAVLGALLMREQRGAPVRPAGERATFLGTVTAGIATVRGEPVLRLLCLLTLAASFAAFPIYMLWQPHMQDLAGEGPRLMGWIFALISLSSLAGSAILPRVLGRARRETVLCAAALWRAATLAIAAAASSFPVALVAFVLGEMAFGLSEPVLSAWTNEHITSDDRATVLSVRSTFMTLGGATGLVAIGLVARGFGVPLAWAVSAAVFAFTAPVYLRLGRLAAAPPAPATAIRAETLGVG
jgi:MFS family permease